MPASLEPSRRKDERHLAAPTGTVRRALTVAEALFSRGGVPPPTTRLDWLGRELEDFLAHVGPRSRFLLASSIWLLALLTPLFGGRLTALHRMGIEERITLLSRMESRLPPIVLAVKALLCLLYYEHPDAAREVGFDGACALPPAEDGTSP